MSITDTCSNENLRKDRAEYRITLGQIENVKKYIEERKCGTLNESISSQLLVCAKMKNIDKHYSTAQIEDAKKYMEEHKCDDIINNYGQSSQLLVCAKIMEFLKEREEFVNKYEQCRHTLYQSNELQEIQEVDRVVSVRYEEPKMEFITTDINANHNIDIAYIDSDFSEPSKDPTVTNIEGQKICWFEI